MKDSMMDILSLFQNSNFEISNFWIWILNIWNSNFEILDKTVFSTNEPGIWNIQWLA